MEKQQQATLLLRVINGNQLESGKKSDYLFTTDGGTIGSSDGATWSLQDVNGHITSSHTTVMWRDGAFCLLGSGALLKVNDSAVTTANNAVRLQQGDMVSLGDLQLKAYLAYDDKSRVDPATYTPESLVSRHSNPLEDMFDGTAGKPITITDDTIAPTVRSRYSQDPLTALKSEQLTTLEESNLPEQDPLLHDAEQTLEEGHYQGTRFTSSISDNKERVMDRDFIDLPTRGDKAKASGKAVELRRKRRLDPHKDSVQHQHAEQQKKEASQDMEQQHVAITPLMRGLDSTVPLPTTQEAWEFLEEAGNTLREAIAGLLALHQVQDSLSDKQLRPLEDNPLRLNLDYDTTLGILFGEEKSPVHLSAPSAVAESLHNLRLHYEANNAAIRQALTTMLDAFSPQALLTRFTHYRRSSERGEMDGEWAWEMYCNYYQELASSRQFGFEKLFREVYGQAYDRELRRRQRESEV